ncbi:DUF4421 domain-containing protein [Niabella pedocola]|uniref:DUF4421 domain-containing protein n=1 Tax=Niabella pedocola TaxID=1752077 RepID=A0ABS8PWK1_9BACT|nr:DUF4421 family protein [Niabella pedocola]MCD2424652.1 DUF4421 domain-containing protein [Niabella pedocola]
MKKVIAVLLVLSMIAPVFAQEETAAYKQDTSYYQRYNHRLTLGPLLVKKNSVYSIRSQDGSFPLKYSTNNPTRLGLSIGYDWLSVSGSVGLGTLDPDYKKEKGKTKSANFQMSVTGQSVLGDLHFQVNKGFYLRGQQDPDFAGGSYYVRPDIKTQIFGATIRKILKGDRFSIKAPFVYDSWQQRSAGSFLIGGEFIYGNAKGDSAFVPVNLSSSFPNASINYMRYIMFGPTAGYAHTFVIKRHLFITGVASVNGDAAQTFEKTTTGAQRTRWYFSPNLSVRGAIGYNTEKWELVGSVISNRFFIGSNEKDANYQNASDQFRLVYVRRIHAGKTIPAVINWGRRAIHTLGFGWLLD